VRKRGRKIQSWGKPENRKHEEKKGKYNPTLGHKLRQGQSKRGRSKSRDFSIRGKAPRNATGTLEGKREDIKLRGKKVRRRGKLGVAT